MMYKYFLFWLPMIVIAFANATLRELVFIQYMKESFAYQLSTITLIVFTGIYVGLIFPFLNIKTSKQAFLAGGIWVILTGVFEFFLGRLSNKPWKQLLENYNLSTGHIWPLFLLALFLFPFFNYTVRRW
jgi:predicted transporter